MQKLNLFALDKTFRNEDYKRHGTEFTEILFGQSKGNILTTFLKRTRKLQCCRYHYIASWRSTANKI